MAGWLQRRREARALQRRAIADELWQACLADLPFIALRPAEQHERLRRMASLFLDCKEFTGAQGFVVTDRIDDPVEHPAGPQVVPAIPQMP